MILIVIVIPIEETIELIKELYAGGGLQKQVGIPLMFFICLHNIAISFLMWGPINKSC